MSVLGKWRGGAEGQRFVLISSYSMQRKMYFFKWLRLSDLPTSSVLLPSLPPPL